MQSSNSTEQENSIFLRELCLTAFSQEFAGMGPVLFTNNDWQNMPCVKTLFIEYPGYYNWSDYIFTLLYVAYIHSSISEDK